MGREFASLELLFFFYLPSCGFLFHLLNSNNWSNLPDSAAAERGYLMVGPGVATPDVGPMSCHPGSGPGYGLPPGVSHPWMSGLKGGWIVTKSSTSVLHESVEGYISGVDHLPLTMVLG